MYKRTYASTPLAALIALSLFVLMTQLISNKQKKISSINEVTPYSFVPTQPKTKEPKVEPEEIKPELKEPKPYTRPSISSLISDTPDIVYTAPSRNAPIEDILNRIPPDFSIEHGEGFLNQATPTIKMAMSPMYPINARGKGIEGFVKVQISVDIYGDVINVEIVESSPKRTFDANVLKTVYRWKFNPAIQDGVAIPSIIQQVIEFKLDEM